MVTGALDLPVPLPKFARIDASDPIDDDSNQAWTSPAADEIPTSGWFHSPMCRCLDCLAEPIVCPECGARYDKRKNSPPEGERDRDAWLTLHCPCGWDYMTLRARQRFEAGRKTVAARPFSMSHSTTTRRGRLVSGAPRTPGETRGSEPSQRVHRERNVQDDGTGPAAPGGAWSTPRAALHVIPLHTSVDGSCSCGKATCASRGKRPRSAHGVKDATTGRGPDPRMVGALA